MFLGPELFCQKADCHFWDVSSTMRSVCVQPNCIESCSWPIHVCYAHKVVFCCDFWAFCSGCSATGYSVYNVMLA